MIYTSMYQAPQVQVESIGYEIKCFRCGNGWGEYNNRIFRYVLGDWSTACKPFPPYRLYNNGVAEQINCSIFGKTGAMMVDSQAPILVSGEEVKTVVYLHQ
jgi:hypothetical protein